MVVSGSSAYYLDLPRLPQQEGTEAPAWRVHWKRYGLAEKVPEGVTDTQDGEPAAKRPRLASHDWLRSAAGDAIDAAYAALPQAGSEEKRYAIIKVVERDDKLDRDLWLFNLDGPDQSPLPTGLQVNSEGSFDFETLFPSISSSTRTLAQNAEPSLLAAYDAFLDAARERVLRLLCDHLPAETHAERCGAGILLSSPKTGSDTVLSCQPKLSFRQAGLVVHLDIQPSLLRSLAAAKDIKEGAAVLLAPMGVQATYLRTLASSKAPSVAVAAKGSNLAVVRLRLARSDAEQEEVWWPASQCLIDTASPAPTVPATRKDIYRARQSLEAKQLSTAAYIEAVAREREKERRERQMALAKHQFGVNTPSSAVNTPLPQSDAATPGALPPQTPGSLGPEVSTVGSHSAVTSPAQVQQPLRADPVAAPEEAVPMDWTTWSAQPAFEDTGGSGGFNLQLDEADFSFFDDIAADVQMEAPDQALLDQAMQMETYVPTPSPAFMAGPSPSVPSDLVNASSTSGESPNGRTPRTPYTPFATVDTEQTDPAIMPSPGAAYIHFPLNADAGFGAIDFDDDESFMPPAALYCSKHGRVQPLASPFDSGKEGKRASLRQRFGSSLRQSKGKDRLRGCPCDLMQSGREARSTAITPRSTPRSHGTEEEVQVVAPIEVSSDDESDAEVLKPEDVLPSIGPSLERLGWTGALLLARPLTLPDLPVAAFLVSQKPYDRLRTEIFLGLVTDCLLHTPTTAVPSSRAINVPLLTSTLPSAELPAMQQLDIAKIRCCRRDSVLDLDLSVMRFWQRLELAPWSGTKDVHAYVLDLTGEADAAALVRCAQQIGAKYEACGFGQHAIGAVAQGEELAGFVRWPADLEADGVRLALRELAKRMLTAAHEAKRQILFYVLASEATPLADQIYNVHRNIFPGPTVSQALILPAASVAELEAKLLPPTDGDESHHLGFKLALAAYERIKVITSRMRLRPEGMIETKWPKSSIATFGPAFTLARPQSKPHFTFDWPPRQLETLERGRLLHIAYCVSDDWEWAGLASIDECCEERMFRPIWIGQSKETPTNRARKLLEILTGRFLSDVLFSSKVEFSIVLTRVGVPSVEELQMLKERFTAGCAKAKQSFEVTIAAIQLADPASPTLSKRAGEKAGEGDICVLRSESSTSLQPVEAETRKPGLPQVIASSCATVAMAHASSYRPLFDASIFLRAATPAYVADLAPEAHDQLIFRSLAHQTAIWRARSPGRNAHPLPWHVDVATLFCRDVVAFVNRSPPELFLQQQASGPV